MRLRTPKLELVSVAAIKELQGTDFSFNKNDIGTTYNKLKKAITAYDLEHWIESAELFVDVWRYSENELAGHLEFDLALYNTPKSLDEDLSREEDNIRTICWLGIYALHDAATAYYQAPGDEYDPGKIKHSPKSYVRDSNSNSETTNFGPVTGDELIIGDDSESIPAGLPVSSILNIEDSIGKLLSKCKTSQAAAHYVSILCMRRLRLTTVSTQNVISVQLQELNLRRINSNLPLILATTVRGTTWVQNAGLRTLKMARNGSSGEDKGWKEILEDMIRKASRNPLNMMILEPYPYT